MAAARTSILDVHLEFAFLARFIVRFLTFPFLTFGRMAIQLGSEEGPASSSKDGLELVTDAYYIFAVITYRWPAVLNEWHVRV